MTLTWTRLGDRLPEVAQHILLASKREGDGFWRVRDAVLLIRHEDVHPSISDFGRDGIPSLWWFDSIYCNKAGADIRLPRPDHLWTPMPVPDEPPKTADIVRAGHIERLKLLQKRASAEADTEQYNGHPYRAKDRRREAGTLEWALKELGVG